MGTKQIYHNDVLNQLANMREILYPVYKDIHEKQERQTFKKGLF